MDPDSRGLPVLRYSAEQLHAEFGQSFGLMKGTKEYHQPPPERCRNSSIASCERTASFGVLADVRLNSGSSLSERGYIIAAEVGNAH